METANYMLHENLRKHRIEENGERAAAVIDRMLDRYDELKKPSQELVKQLGSDQVAMKTFIRVFIHTATHHTPEYFRDQRDRRDELKEVNSAIAELAFKLSTLLKRRTYLHETSGFTSNTSFHIVDFIERASQHNGHFRSILKNKLTLLRGQHDLKYWPNISEILSQIGSDASQAAVVPIDDTTAAGTESQRSSRADFLRVLFEEIEWNQHPLQRYLPSSFRLSDGAWASLVSVALNDDLEAQYIKSFRHKRGSSKQDGPP